MPALYAHQRFAREVLPCLRKKPESHEALYFAGSLGPDPLFYYNPFRKNPVEDLGNDTHNCSGRDVFSQACARLKGEEGSAYLFGLLTHYCLDSCCHPYVNALAETGECNHTELETEFDRFLLEMDKEPLPHRKDLGEKIRLTASQCSVAARAYPGITGKQYGKCLKNLRRSTRILSGKTVLRRKLLERALPHFGSNVRYQLMTLGANPRVHHKIPKLMECYNKARERFPILLMQLENHLHLGTPLGEEFSPEFG